MPFSDGTLEAERRARRAGGLALVLVSVFWISCCFLGFFKGREGPLMLRGGSRLVGRGAVSAGGLESTTLGVEEGEARALALGAITPWNEWGACARGGPMGKLLLLFLGGAEAGRSS